VLTYIAIVAITNLGIGWMLGCFFPIGYFTIEDAGLRTLSKNEHSTNRIPLTKTVHTASPSNESRAHPPHDVQASDTVKKDHVDNTSFTKSGKTWADYVAELNEAARSANYCRTSRDKQLARQAAGKLSVCIQKWHVDLQTCLEESAADTLNAFGLVNVQVAAIEMFSAQVETSLSNLESIDWTGSFDDVIERLDYEINLLSEQQELVVRTIAKV
jgi:hypothetical protein